MNNIYLDNAGTTPMDPAVIETMTEMMQNVLAMPRRLILLVAKRIAF